MENIGVATQERLDKCYLRKLENLKSNNAPEDQIAIVWDAAMKAFGIQGANWYEPESRPILADNPRPNLAIG